MKIMSYLCKYQVKVFCPVFFKKQVVSKGEALGVNQGFTKQYYKSVFLKVTLHL